MAYSPLNLSRRHVLGSLYDRCERGVKIPVYLNDANGEVLGFADESLGKYADAFTFHLSEDHCKKLAGGQFTYSFDYNFADSAKSGKAPDKRTIKLVSIYLTMRKGYEKPVPKSARKDKSEPVDAVS